VRLNNLLEKLEDVRREPASLEKPKGESAINALIRKADGRG
jgi:hypothetical protein